MLIEGRIIKGVGGRYIVDSGGEEYTCMARGIFRKQKIKPLVGDIVQIDEKESVITYICDRKNQLIRPAVANIDQLIIVFAACQPSPDLNLIDKLLIAAEKNNIDSIICINKSDLDEEENYKDYKEQYESAGYKVIVTSCIEELNVQDIEDIVKDKCTAFAGQSGVGKSTILNTVSKENLMETGKISRKIERGKHTTRHVELLKLSDSTYIVDTPGFSSFEIESIESKDLENYYPEIKKHTENCRFAGCSHIAEPECVVKDAVAEGKIHKERYQRYIDFYNKLKEFEKNKYR